MGAAAVPRVVVAATAEGGIGGGAGGVDANKSTSTSAPACPSRKRTTALRRRREEDLRRGVALCSTSLALLVGGWAVCAPFLQARRDELGCDAPCAGAATSVRSVLELVGSALVGRLSDAKCGTGNGGTGAVVDAAGGGGRNNTGHGRRRWGRRLSTWRSCRDRCKSLLLRTVGGSGRIACLYVGTAASFVGWLVALHATDMRGLVISQAPNALLQNNASVMKALLAEYHAALELVEVEVEVDEGGESLLKSQAFMEEGVALRSRDGEPASSMPKKGDATGTTTDGGRADSMGKLGMSVGLAVMIGPMCGATHLVRTYGQAVGVALVFTALSAAAIALLPRPRISVGVADGKSSCTLMSSSDVKGGPLCKGEKPTGKTRVAGWVLLPCRRRRSPSLGDPALLLVTMRACMTLAYHVFAVAWVPSLKYRFGFGSSDHARFMSFVGLSYALSQGVIAKIAIRRFGGGGGGGDGGDGQKVRERVHGRGRVRLVLACCVTLGCGRYLAFQTSNLLVVYLIFFFVVMALGVVNTVLSVDASRVAPPGGLGTLFGSLEAAECGAGIVGPALGGILGGAWPVKGPLAAVLVLYGVVFGLVFFRYEEVVLRRGAAARRSGGGGRVPDDDDIKVVEAAGDHEEVMLLSGDDSRSCWIGRRHRSTAEV